jgi:glycosyltransferase involved in cell wall biosynthesis
MKISLVILTYNEIIGLKDIYSKIPFEAVDEAFAVDGGSKDGTLEFFEQNNFPVHIQKTKGRGEAFRIAFQQAKGDAIIFFSPDGNEDPSDIPRFRAHLEAGADMVVGTRMVPGAHNEEDEQFFKWRKWANNAFNIMANLTWNRGKYMTDTINGFRAIRKSAWDKLALDGPGYTIEYQSSIRSFKLGLKIAEFPTFESARIDGREGSPSIGTGLAFLKMYFKELFRDNSSCRTENKSEPTRRGA